MYLHDDAGGGGDDAAAEEESEADQSDDGREGVRAGRDETWGEGGACGEYAEDGADLVR